jgi:hypothetical protein
MAVFCFYWQPRYTLPITIGTAFWPVTLNPLIAVCAAIAFSGIYLCLLT